jgi:hypothetical protein
MESVIRLLQRKDFLTGGLKRNEMTVVKGLSGARVYKDQCPALSGRPGAYLAVFDHQRSEVQRGTLHSEAVETALTLSVEITDALDPSSGPRTAHGCCNSPECRPRAL